MIFVHMLTIMVRQNPRLQAWPMQGSLGLGRRSRRIVRGGALG